ncbi:hypothetical protein GN244_ATG03535 [Phytophthora infestans]|uniref:Uncharacterized protein n=1 Tax=Phytophthora infestans TaxID=4787 RepID=A0A833TIS6_PHYIN|nr:hypothetical protein GN244_ATG03535 [Phytophthora infestans]KAF4145563.1 hypothetical protein GN958_ATG05238 [Phytophthora infestans]
MKVLSRDVRPTALALLSWNIFDSRIAEHPGVEGYLGMDTGIVQQPEFEDACVTAVAGKAEIITEYQRCFYRLIIT